LNKQAHSFGLKYLSIPNATPSDMPWPEFKPLPRKSLIRKRYGIKEKPFNHLPCEFDIKNPKAKLPAPPQIFAGAPKEYKIMDSRPPLVQVNNITPEVKEQLFSFDQGWTYSQFIRSSIVKNKEE
jgi:hypothetical protein